MWKYTTTHTTHVTWHAIPFCTTLPIEVQNQFMEAPLQELHIPVPLGGGHLVHSPHRPRMHGWVDIAEVELICRDLPIGGHVPLPHKQDQLLLGKFWVHFREWDQVESQVPRGILQVKGSFIHKRKMGRGGGGGGSWEEGGDGNIPRDTPTCLAWR